MVEHEVQQPVEFGLVELAQGILRHPFQRGIHPDGTERHCKQVDRMNLSILVRLGMHDLLSMLRTDDYSMADHCFHHRMMPHTVELDPVLDTGSHLDRPTHQTSLPTMHNNKFNQ